MSWMELGDCRHAELISLLRLPMWLDRVFHLIIVREKKLFNNLYGGRCIHLDGSWNVVQFVH